jgi:hypothetical protein
MHFARAAFLSLIVALAAPQAVAQDLDLPMPSSGSSKKAKAAKRRGSQKPSAKKSEPAASAPEDLDVPLPSPTPAKKTQAPDDLDVPLPTPKSPTAKKPEPLEADEDLIPTVGKNSLVLKLSTSAKGGRLFVDNKDMGTLPLSAPIQLEPGEHALVVRKPGFADFSRRITAQKTRPTEVAVALEAVAGVVSVTAETPGATVSIDGQPRGQVPVIGVVLKPGTHEIVVSKEGFEPDKQSLAVKAGKEYTVVASPKPSQPVAVARNDRPQQPNLTPPPPTVTQPNPLTQTVPEVEPSQPWFKRWYVWAGVGVVAAAATTGAVMATRGGKLSETDVCGAPGCDGVINGIRPMGAR